MMPWNNSHGFWNQGGGGPAFRVLEPSGAAILVLGTLFSPLISRSLSTLILWDFALSAFRRCEKPLCPGHQSSLCTPTLQNRVPVAWSAPVGVMAGHGIGTPETHHWDLGVCLPDFIAMALNADTPITWPLA